MEAGVGTEDKEHAMSLQSNRAIAVIGIDIGKNSFHIQCDLAGRAASRANRTFGLTRKSEKGRFCCKSLFGVSNKNS
jgi:hypothetical protein